jgi:hypothetical protein
MCGIWYSDKIWKLNYILEFGANICQEKFSRNLNTKNLVLAAFRFNYDFSQSDPFDSKIKSKSIFTAKTIKGGLLAFKQAVDNFTLN